MVTKGGLQGEPKHGRWGDGGFFNSLLQQMEPERFFHQSREQNKTTFEFILYHYVQQHNILELSSFLYSLLITWQRKILMGNVWNVPGWTSNSLISEKCTTMWKSKKKKKKTELLNNYPLQDFCPEKDLYSNKLTAICPSKIRQWE